MASSKDPLWVGLSALTLVIATLAVNIAANVVSPANDFANAWPKHIDFRRGALITGIMGILCMPWKLTEDSHAYLVGWLVLYSGGLGAIAAIMVVDYWLIRKRSLLYDLYVPDGSYRYRRGWNPVAVVATLVGCGLSWADCLFPRSRGFTTLRGLSALPQPVRSTTSACDEPSDSMSESRSFTNL